jgi:hypothetical protein
VVVVNVSGPTVEGDGDATDGTFASLFRQQGVAIYDGPAISNAMGTTLAVTLELIDSPEAEGEVSGQSLLGGLTSARECPLTSRTILSPFISSWSVGSAHLVISLRLVGVAARSIP